MMGNADTGLIAKKVEDGPNEPVWIVPTKQRSSARGGALRFLIEPYVVGTNKKGREVTVPMAVPLVNDGTEMDSVEEQPPKKLSLAEARMADVLAVLTKLDRENPRGWVDVAAIREQLGVSFDAVRKNPDSFRRTLADLLAKLVKRGDVESGENKTFRIAAAA